jgi:hypothetical protein
MMMTMYKKILPLVNRFVYLRQGYFNRYYEGKIIEVTPDTLTLQAYDDQGRVDSQWVIAMPTVTEFMTGDRDLDELNMKVSMAKTIEQAELSELEQVTQQLNALAFSAPPLGETNSLVNATKSSAVYGYTAEGLKTPPQPCLDSTLGNVSPLSSLGTHSIALPTSMPTSADDDPTPV